MFVLGFFLFLYFRLYHRKPCAEMRDLREENPIEEEVSVLGLNYVDLDGNVGCMVNGAGLAMATMNLIKIAVERLPIFGRWRYCGC
jgi:succinyl-CoA synthetase beta subunit